MKITDKNKCVGCYACYNVCNRKCIQFNIDSEGFYYPYIDSQKCIECNRCRNVCPIESAIEEKSVIKTYASINIDEKIRKESSSGGIFSVLAENIINDGGIVFGACFSEDYKEVNHEKITKINDIYKLRGSKYIQSNINDCYSVTKKYLLQGKKVLFTGTPCQIAGLYSYLGKDYDNLYTQDFICHGVPSPSIWRKYTEYIEKKMGANIECVYFRNKIKGWKNYSISFLFKNKKEIVNSIHKDLYMRAYLLNYSIRKSCYSCEFKGGSRIADVSLADFWGIENFNNISDDDKGTSLVFINSKKGNKMWESIESKLNYIECDFDEVVKYNEAAIKSVKEPKNREKFMRDICKYPINYTLYKWCGNKFWVRVKNYAKRKMKEIFYCRF